MSPKLYPGATGACHAAFLSDVNRVGYTALNILRKSDRVSTSLRTRIFSELMYGRKNYAERKAIKVRHAENLCSKPDNSYPVSKGSTVECPLFALICGITVFYFLRYQPKFDHFCKFQG